MMTDETWLNPTKGPSENEVAIDYLKSQDFRSVWADGLIGSITPQGLIHFAIYSERQAIPRRQVFTIVKDESENIGSLGTEVVEKQISRGSIVREMSCDVFVSPSVAEAVGKWLIEQANIIKDLKGKSK
jgi:hypothetical protein